MEGSTSTIERLAQVSGSEFSPELQKRWSAVEQVKDLVDRLVQNDELEPIDGFGIISAAVGQVFAYPYFHGDVKPADMLAQLDPGRRLAGSSR